MFIEKNLVTVFFSDFYLYPHDYFYANLIYTQRIRNQSSLTKPHSQASKQSGPKFTHLIFLNDI